MDENQNNENGGIFDVLSGRAPIKTESRVTVGISPEVLFAIFAIIAIIVGISVSK